MLAVITAFMTAFYMFRMWFMTFMGEEGHATQHCHGESPKTMTVPLMILSVFAVASGFLILFGLDSVVSFNVTDAGFVVGGAEAGGMMHYFEHLFTNPYTYLTIVLALVGIGIAYLMYAKKTVDPGKFNKNGNSWFYKVLANRWYFPEFYNQVSWKLGYGVARGVNFVDRQVIDGTVNGLSGAVVGSGDAMSKMQTGHVQDYASVVLIGVAVLSVVFIIIAYTLGGF